MIKKYPIIKILSLVFVLIIASCDNKKNNTYRDVHDLTGIKKRGQLIVLTDYNSTSYFIYRGTPMGFQYDILQLLAKDLDLELVLKVSNDLGDSFEKLENNECDILAMNITHTNSRKQKVLLLEPLGQTTQVLIQKKPDDWRHMASYNIRKHLIMNQLELAGKTIHVAKNTAFIERLENLSDEIGDSIFIEQVLHYGAEQLISLVDKGEIDYTVCEKNVMLLYQPYYPDLHYQTPISFPQNYGWAVNKSSIELQQEIDKWLINFKKTAKFAYLYNKYYKHSSASQRVVSDYISVAGGKISQYDDLIKKHSETIGWDWRLLASLIYQESRFDPNAKSWAGAFGLMQLMPITANTFGASRNSDLEMQMRAGTKFINWLDKRYADSIPNKDERIKFILASYNAGPGHVDDARRLASANGKDNKVWKNNVDYFILNKSNPEYYDSELVKHGHLRGIETYNYVNQITKRYEAYKKVIQ